MPLNRPALSLGSGPRGVQDARRWVVDTCHDIGRSDLVECAELGVSELVTNALLHAGPPLSVRVRGTREHPRVEVRDGSVELPQMPTAGPADDDDLMLTFGRGLSIVARCSTAWGVEVEEDGKVVWFVPAAESGDEMVEGVVTGEAATPVSTQPSADELRIDIQGVPLRAFVEFQRHYRELRREVRLLALAHESDYPLAKDLSEVFDTLGRPLSLGLGSDEVVTAQDAGRDHTDLRIVMSRAHALGLDRFVELLELTDEFCRAEKMLSLARTPQQRAFQNWFLGQFVHQAGGEAPQRWTEPVVTRDRRSSVS